MGQSTMGLVVGEQFTVGELLKGVLVQSGNDAATLIAEHVGGTVAHFVEMMNAKAKQLGMSRTKWVNPNGLPAENHVTSARDLAILARALIREFPEYDSYWHISDLRGCPLLRRFRG